MRHYNLYLLAVVFLLCGCTQKGSTVTAQHAVQENVHTTGQKKKQEKSADTLSLAQAGDTVMADVSETEGISDSLRPVHVYTFNYADPSFPHSYGRNGKTLMLKGFDTDGKGRLYIAGGMPIRLACYNERQKEYDVVISNDTVCNHGIMTLLGDSILFVEEGLKRLAIFSKDGTGEVRYCDLPLKETDSIVNGRAYDGRVILHVYDGSEKALRREKFASDTLLRLVRLDEECRNNTHACEISLSAEGPAIRWNIPDGHILNPFDDGEKCSFTIQGISYDYFGKCKGMPFFLFHCWRDIGGYGHPFRIALVDEKDEWLVRAEAVLAQTPPFTTCCVKKRYMDYITANIYRLKGYSFFLSGYDNDTKIISFLEYDLKPLFDKANASLSAEAEEQTSDKHAALGDC